MVLQVSLSTAHSERSLYHATRKPKQQDAHTPASSVVPAGPRTRSNLFVKPDDVGSYFFKGSPSRHHRAQKCLARSKLFLNMKEEYAGVYFSHCLLMNVDQSLSLHGVSK